MDKTYHMAWNIQTWSFLWDWLQDLSQKQIISICNKTLCSLNHDSTLVVSEKDMDEKNLTSKFFANLVETQESFDANTSVQTGINKYKLTDCGQLKEDQEAQVLNIFINYQFKGASNNDIT